MLGGLYGAGIAFLVIAWIAFSIWVGGKVMDRTLSEPLALLTAVSLLILGMGFAISVAVGLVG